MYSTNHSLPNNKNSKIYIEYQVIIISFCLALLVLFFIAKPIYTETKINRDQLALIAKNTNLKNRALASLEDFENQNKSINNRELMKVKSLFSEEDQVELYIANINKISQLSDSNMDIISLLIGETGSCFSSQKNDLKQVTIDLSLTGEYDKLMTFLERVERVIPLMNIELLKIEKNDSENDIIIDNFDKGINITADITLSFYY